MRWSDEYPDVSDGEWYDTPEPDEDERAPDWDWADDDEEDDDDAE